MPRAPQPKIIAPPYRLADRVEEGSGPDLDTILERVNRGIETLRQDYLDGAQSTMTELESAFAEAMGTDGPARHGAVQRIFRAGHDLRGVAATFGYPLVTRIGSSLCDFIKQCQDFGPRPLHVIELHIGAVKVIMERQLTGDGGAEGQELVSGIDTMVDKVLAQD